MAAYAETTHVKSRGGRAAQAWKADSTPGDPDLEGYLTTAAGTIDALIGGHGHDTPVTGAAAAALEGLNADMALLVALAATYPGRDNQAVADLRANVQRRVDSEWAALQAGTHGVLILLGDDSGSTPAATSFWQEEPAYGQFGAFGDANPWHAPAVRRRQKL